PARLRVAGERARADVDEALVRRALHELAQEARTAALRLALEADREVEDEVRAVRAHRVDDLARLALQREGHVGRRSDDDDAQRELHVGPESSRRRALASPRAAARLCARAARSAATREASERSPLHMNAFALDVQASDRARRIA